MYNRESRNFTEVPTPNGLESLDKELASIKWISSSLNAAQRIPACKRRDTLVLALTNLLLEDPAPKLDQDLNSAQQVVNRELSELQKEKELLKAANHELESQFLDDLISDRLQPNLNHVVNNHIAKHRNSIIIWTVVITTVFMILLHIILFHSL